MSYVEVCDRIEAMIEAEESGDISIFIFKSFSIIRVHLHLILKTRRAVNTMSKFFGRIIVRLGSRCQP